MRVPATDVCFVTRHDVSRGALCCVAKICPTIRGTNTLEYLSKYRDNLNSQPTRGSARANLWIQRKKCLCCHKLASGYSQTYARDHCLDDAVRVARFAKRFNNKICAPPVYVPFTDFANERTNATAQITPVQRPNKGQMLILRY